jgi:glutathione S-transferase
MLTLEVKGLAYESKLLEFSKGDHKTPAYLQLNPRGKVPTLKDGDFVIYESLAIMSYLDRKYPAKPLFGTTAEETGLIWQTISECESYFKWFGRCFSAKAWTGSTKFRKRPKSSGKN